MERAGTESPAGYRHIAELIAEGTCVILDGGMGTELGGSHDALDEPLWGTRALIDQPDAVLRVHERYLEAGCDLLSTNTWGLASAIAGHGPRVWDAPVHWMDVARRGLRLARRAVTERGREGRCAVAFSLNGDVDSDAGGETIRLLARLFDDEPEPPDLILVETLSLLRDSLYETIDRLLGTGLPVWLSFRRCRHGLCGVYGEHWGGPEGDAFGRAARRFEVMGVQALLVNCVPPDHVDGMVSYLRDFTDLPLGAYPNLGYYTDRGWRFDPGVSGEEYAEMALRWRAEGAQIIGGCCGVRPEHITAARGALKQTRPGHGRPDVTSQDGTGQLDALGAAPPPAWTDRRRRELYPLPFPDLSVEPGVFTPGEPSFMAWRYLFREATGARQRCLDVGCGTGLLAVQLALNGASHVLAIDIDPRAVANTLGNAFRNDVAERVTARAVDLYPWVPEERYEVIVASLFQRPRDPFRQVPSHRWGDYWGRNDLDQLLSKLPDALAPEGAAYVVQFSFVSQERTAELLRARGLTGQVVDYTMFDLPPAIAENREQVGRVEELSDAYHLRVGEREVAIAYLLEIRHAA